MATVQQDPAPPAYQAEEAAAVAAELRSDRQRGLGAADAGVRLAANGPNELTGTKAAGPWPILLAQLSSPILILLMAAGVLSAVLGDVAEAIVILAVVILNVWIGFAQEYKAEKAMAALNAMAAPTVKVRRDSLTQEIPAREVVPGDLALLEAGAHVPADGRLTAAENLRVDESALTGESASVEKAIAPVSASTPLAERTSMAYSGTDVTAGRGQLVVTATGMTTELGHIAELLDDADPGSTPLQDRLDVLVRQLAMLAGVIVLIVFVLGLLRGEDVEELLLTAVTLAVAAIPESLSAVVTITLALGAQRMLARNALIRRLYAVETLGSVTVICSDKTGTLTQNKMTVTTLDVAGRRHDIGGEEHAAEELREQPTLRLLLTGGALCNDTSVGAAGVLLGDPTETCLVVAAERYGLHKPELEASYPRTFELPFDSGRKRMTTVHRQAAAAGQVAFTKGSVDGLLPRCSRISVDGEVVDLDAELRGRALGAADAMARDGVRVLGVAMRRWGDGEDVPHGEELETELTFLGLEGMSDPPRPEVRDAVATCAQAGVRALMITGDHPLTAAAIGEDLGLVGAGARVVTGAELAGLEDAELDATVREVALYARVAPEHKIRIVESLQRQGEVVAMTGDGVNDAPAIEQADIGVAMGITGTDVTKDAADMILVDDNFATIVGAVREGRIVFDNIRKFIRYILSCNIAEVVVMVVGPLLGTPLPLVPLQILWLNLVTDGLPAMALAVEPGEPGVMQRRPTPLGESLLGEDRGVRILTRGVVLALVAFVPAFLLWHSGNDAWQTVLFTSLALAELAAGFAMRSERVSLRRLGPFTNHALVGAVAVTVGLQVLVVSIPFARDLLRLEVLSPAEWGLTALIALSYVSFLELDKAWQRRSAGPGE